VLEEFFDLVLRRLSFELEDLVMMSDSDICIIFAHVDVKTLAIALAGVGDAVRSKVLGALPDSLTKPLRYQLDNLGPFRLSASDTAQLEIADTVRRLRGIGRVRSSKPSKCKASS
jgi:flagellar motor switch protein FliG